MLAKISHFWDIGCTVSVMVARHVADPYSDVGKSPGGGTTATLRVVDHDVAGASPAGKLMNLSAPLGSVLTWELDGAAAGLGLAVGEMLVAALGRAIARTIGEGLVGVDVVGAGHPIVLSCAGLQRASAAQALGAVHRTLAGLPQHHWGPGLPQSFYTSAAAPDGAHSSSEIAFNDLGEVAEPPSEEPVWATQSLHRALELRAYRSGGLRYLQWWYDGRRFFPSTVEELAEQFPLALIELTSEAVAPV